MISTLPKRHPLALKFLTAMRFFRIFVLAACISVAPSGALAQEQPSSVLAEIHATGSAHFPEAQIAAVSGLKPGESVTRDQLQAAADRLAQSGMFSRVNYRFTSRGNSIVLEFDLVDAPAVPVTFDNFPWFTDEQISAAIRESVPFFNGTVPQSGGVLDTITAALTKLLQAHNISGTVEHTLLAQPDSNDMTVQFRVNGPSVAIGSLAFGDTLAQTSSEIEQRKNDLLEKPFSRFSIELFELEQIRPLYLETGHLRVNFAPPVAGLTAAPNQPASSNVSVQIPIDPGPVFHLSGVNWDGNHALDSNALSALETVKAGELADGMELAALWQSVQNAYGHAGYIQAQIAPKPHFDDATATVAYDVTITEGQQYRMGGLVLTGLSPEAEGALRGAWQLASGKIFDSAYADKMFTKLEKPSRDIFGSMPIHYEKEGHLLRVNEANHTVDVLIDFQ